LISVAAGQLAVSWWYARKIVVTKILVTWRECYDESREMVQLGLAMVTSNVALTVSTMVILVIVRNYEGVAAVGLYQSAITISSIYIGFILQGMSGDYFPRLVAVADDRDGRNQVVCEQAEMAMLLAVPGLIGVLIFSSLLVATLYSSRFDGASEILGWLVLGMLGRIVSWPQGFILFARSDKAALIYTELLTALFHVSMVLLAVRYFGVVGAGMSFAAQYGLHVWLISWIVKHKHAFVLLKRTRSIVITGTALVMVSFGTSYIQLPVIRYTCGIAVFVFAIAWSLRGLAKRLGSSQVMRVVERVARLPMLGFVERIFAYLLKKG
jgi:PST family polysaccharide transporter